MSDYSHYASEKLAQKKLNIIKNAFNTLRTSLNNEPFESYKEKILTYLDNIDSSLQNLYMSQSIYKLVENCDRETMSNYIIHSDSLLIENCIGQIEIQANEYCNID